MGLPAFRFVATGQMTPSADRQFWRDVEASDRLGSAAKANLFLRELCRMKAAEDAGGLANDAESASCHDRERALLQEVYARGYRVVRSEAESFEEFSAAAA